MNEASAITKIHEILAEEAGIGRENRVFANFRSPAVAIVADFKRTRAIPEGPTGDVLRTLGETLDHNAAIRQEQRAVMTSFVAERRAVGAPPAGVQFVYVRDEITRQLHKLTIPVEWFIPIQE